MENKTNGITLMPCPFCGGEAELCCHDATGISWVRCMHCGVSGNGGGALQAIEEWNTRTGRTCRMVRVEKEERILYGWLECSNCGPVYPPAAIEIQDAVRYCPFCGAKIV